MKQKQSYPVIKHIMAHLVSLTPKGRVIGKFVLQYPLKAVFMTTRELSEACGVSEATVVRFVNQLGFGGYGEFLQALRDYVDTGLTLQDRADLPGMKGPGDRFHKVVFDEMDNLKQFYDSIDMNTMQLFVDSLAKSPWVYVVGSRLSYTFAYYLGWSLTKVRKGVQILNGSDSTAIDWLTNAPTDSLVVMISTSRYPNELIKLGKVARRLGHRLFVIADSPLCPLIQFAHTALTAPSKAIPLIGNPSTIFCIANYLVLELANSLDSPFSSHQEKLEQVYLENDILFNLHVENFDR
ncbi:MAG: MurR/RpiR family transcriptional regulator [Deltaproteobacteria bacterium]|jgi:DNA-binding MurR/RpiR family transcriptional regulator|nr:MurR/RpiR family transcriptional regulator [Deltaproteobacteria bacterium]